ncbi:putative protein N(5)-glutamine methyltransferase [Brevibacillus brevis]|uniref:peptide chain release factor N(5)-glutamine methyltransferase n=1 Tax=Brevibacillus brevis TaxID=1393 RepID=A0ABY9TCR7_BREBE|nr:putative protein N(5)-glutamine methyltransferase [Brevibacillus brevis]WNC17718.1 putative protein N(5)-glutamine methyltransferase [Brevibacillus brevis]
MESRIVTSLRQAGCVYAEEEARLLLSAAQNPTDLASMVERRAAGMPIEHIIGWAEFCGLRIAVEPGVFIPRKRSEFLARLAIALGQSASVAVDLGCGSGALGAVLAAALERIELHAVDIDPAAVRCAKENVTGLGGLVYDGDLFDPLPKFLRGRVGILIANVPYVPTDSIRLLPHEARSYEALVALDGGEDGVDIQRRVAEEAPSWLTAGGHLLVETSERQVPLTVDLFARNGLSTKVAHAKELDATVVIGTKT